MSSPKDVYYGYREMILKKETELKKNIERKKYKDRIILTGVETVSY